MDTIRFLVVLLSFAAATKCSTPISDTCRPWRDAFPFQPQMSKMVESTEDESDLSFCETEQGLQACGVVQGPPVRKYTKKCTCMKDGYTTFPCPLSLIWDTSPSDTSVYIENLNTKLVFCAMFIHRLQTCTNGQVPLAQNLRTDMYHWFCKCPKGNRAVANDREVDRVDITYTTMYIAGPNRERTYRSDDRHALGKCEQPRVCEQNEECAEHALHRQDGVCNNEWYPTATSSNCKCPGSISCSAKTKDMVDYEVDPNPETVDTTARTYCKDN